MGKRKQSLEIPPELRRAQARFAAWRHSHRPRARISEALWAEAVSLARVYGHCRTARALGLDYKSLVRRLAAGPAPGVSDPCQPAFVELTPSAAGECSIEMATAGGARMRISLRGFSRLELDSLSREFWRAGS